MEKQEKLLIEIEERKRRINLEHISKVKFIFSSSLENGIITEQELKSFTDYTFFVCVDSVIQILNSMDDN
jgi:hypothetical protein